jgi:WD40 repeat protein
VFDGETHYYITQFTIGGMPNFILFTPDGSKAYVVDYQNATVTVIRVSDHAILDTLEFEGYALQDAVVSPDGSRVYVSNMDQNRIEVIRTSDNAILSPIVTTEIKPRGIGISPDGDYLFVGHYTAVDAMVNMVRLSDEAVVSSVDIPSNPRRIAVRENGTRIYVTEHNEDKLFSFSVVGETLAQYKVTDLNTIAGYHASPVGVALGAMAHPQLDVKLNGSDGPIYLTQSDSVQLCLSLDANGRTDLLADWWLIGDGPFGTLFWTPSTGWTTSWLPMYQGQVVDVPNFCSPPTPLAGFPPGRYRFFFAIDIQMDGIVEKPLMYWNKAVLFVTE